MIKKISSHLFENKNEKQTIVKNTFWLVSGQILGRLLRTILIIYAARVLGASSWGDFSYALSIAAFLSIFSDLGVNAFTTRELSKNGEKNYRLLSAGFLSKFIFTALLVFLVSLFSDFLSPGKATGNLIFIAALIFAFDSIRDFGSSIIRSSEKMEIESSVNIFTNLAIILFGFLFLFFSKTNLSLSIGYALGSLSGTMLMVFFMRKNLSSFFEKVNFSDIKKVLFLSLPFSIVAVMGAVMINTDIIILNWMSGSLAVGLYSAAEKPVQLLYLLPSMFAASLFPLMAKISEEKEKFVRIFEKSVSAVLAFALPVSLGGFILSKEIILLLYGNEYLGAAPSFALLSLTIFIIFPSIIIGNAVFALNEQKKLIAFSVFGMLGNLILDIILIPRFGAAGSAFATLLNQILINAYLLFKIKKIIPFSLFSRLKKIILASLFMAAGTFFLSSLEFHVLSNIFLSSIFYFSFLFLFKEKLLFSLFKK